MKEFNIKTDQKFFVDLYNSCTRYAPYSIPLDMDKLANHVLRNLDNQTEFVYIYNFDDAKGLIHFGLNPGDSKEGMIHLLLADNNSVARRLLKQTEDKLRDTGVSLIRCFPWQPNPYKGILYGVEAYCWAGLYASNNAFRQLTYDIELDIVVMGLHMDEKPRIDSFENNELVIEEIPVSDDELVTHGQYIAYFNGGQVGRSGYYRLNALSNHLGRGYGQIDIWVNSEYHGRDLGKHLLQLAHRKLYDMGVRNVILATNQNLFRAIKFYEKLGYKAEPIRAYCYVKELND